MTIFQFTPSHLLFLVDPIHIDMLECYDRNCAASRIYFDSESFNFVLERLRLYPERTSPKDGFDTIDIYTSSVWNQGNARLETNLANGSNGSPSASVVWDEWDGGITVAGMTSDRSTTVRSHPRAFARLELYERQRQQPTVPHPDRREPADLQPSLTRTMALVTGGLAIGAELGYKAFRAIGSLDCWRQLRTFCKRFWALKVPLSRGSALKGRSVCRQLPCTRKVIAVGRTVSIDALFISR